MGLTRRREPNPAKRPPTKPTQRHLLVLRDTQIPVVEAHKFLCMLIDQELCWKEHINYMLHKGMKSVMQYSRLAKLMKGISAKYMHRFYLSVVVPRMLYAADLFLTLQSRKTRGTKGFINKLGRIQRLASLHITSAMKPAPTDTINACADLLPFHLLVEKHIHHATTCLATLPASHPLTLHVRKVAGRYVKRHRAPLHEILHSFNIWPKEYKDIVPMSTEPRQELCYALHIPASREIVIAEAGTAQEEVRAYSDGSGIGRQIGVVAILFRDGEEVWLLRKCLGPENQHMVFEGKVTGMILAVELIRMEGHMHSVVRGADSQAVTSHNSHVTLLTNLS